MTRFIAMILMAAVSSSAMAAEWGHGSMQVMAENMPQATVVYAPPAQPYPSPYVSPSPVVVTAPQAPQPVPAQETGEAHLHRMNF